MIQVAHEQENTGLGEEINYYFFYQKANVIWLCDMNPYSTAL